MGTTRLELSLLGLGFRAWRLRATQMAGEVMSSAIG